VTGRRSVRAKDIFISPLTKKWEDLSSSRCFAV
jgi:hypothetical protein